ncbi:MAG: lamin tail domain-containing protein [Bacteroidales bacterium]
MKYCFIVFLLFSLQLSAQLKENFESTGLSLWKASVAGRWSASSDSPVNGNFSLQHTFDNPYAGNDRISLLHHPLFLDSAAARWKFSVKHGYDPSSYNNWAVFLASDNNADEMHPSGHVNAIILGVNYTGSDDFVKIWKTEDNKITEICATGYNWQTETGIDNPARFEAERNNNGSWKIWIEPIDSNQEKRLIAEFSDTTGVKISNYFGLYYKYSASQDRKLWFDDLEIEGCFICDTIPPIITETEVMENSNIKVHFSEDIIGTENLKIEITAELKPLAYDSVSLSGKTLNVWLSGKIENKSEIYVKITDIRDIYGNISPLLSSNFLYYQPQFNDVIVTEIMADPTPVVMLPDVEYVEILNRSNYPVNLKEWQLVVGNRSVTLNAYTLQPKQYLVLCKSSFVGLFQNISAIMGMPSFPQLPNTGQTIILQDRDQHNIHIVEYNAKWYRDNNKSEGGWSLEMIDTENPCGESENWKASEDPEGGTPGFANSVLYANPDFDSPELLKCSIVSDSCLYLVFNEPVAGKFLFNTSGYMADKGMGNPRSVIIGRNMQKHLQLLYEKPFTNTTVYTLQITHDIKDCAGNVIQNNMNYTFQKPLPCNSLDLIINEILYDPFEAEGDFIEIFNRSDKTIDLNGFSIALKNPYTGKLSTQHMIVSYPYTIEPDCYTVLCKYPGKVTAHYRLCPLNSIIEMDNFPVLSNESGTIVLIDSARNIIDEVTFSKKQHFNLAVNTKGVSLERTHNDRASSDPGNWQSASGDAGYATPGLINSQNMTEGLADCIITVEPEIFTPDGSGVHHAVTISYSMHDNGYVANITILDRTGRPVKKLARNTMLGTSGSFTWDGRTESGRVAPVGPYLIYTEAYHLTGMVKKFKNTCIIAERIY